MAKKLKVWGGIKYQYREIVATYTKKRAIELIGNISVKYFNDYFTETYNNRELLIALETPETVFITVDNYHNSEYVRKE